MTYNGYLAAYIEMLMTRLFCHKWESIIIVMKIIIYAICHPETKAIRYIGKTNNIKRRISQYLTKESHNAIGRFIYFLKQQNKKPFFQILEECDESIWKEREVFYINKYKKNILLNSYKGIFSETPPKKETLKKEEFTNLLIEAEFFRTETKILINEFYEFNLIAKLSNGQNYLIYDSRYNSTNNGYYHIYMKKDENMPFPTNYTGNSLEYIKKSASPILRYPIPKKHKIYKLNHLELPLFKGMIECWYHSGCIKINID